MVTHTHTHPQHVWEHTHTEDTQPGYVASLIQKQITSKIWPQANVIAFQQSIHGLFYQWHIARVIDTKK